MTTLKTLFIIALLGTSVSAMAEGGGDRAMARMLALNDTAMQQQHQEEQEVQTLGHSDHSKSVARADDDESNETDRSE